MLNIWAPSPAQSWCLEEQDVVCLRVTNSKDVTSDTFKPSAMNNELQELFCCVRKWRLQYASNKVLVVLSNNVWNPFSGVLLHYISSLSLSLSFCPTFKRKRSCTVSATLRSCQKMKSKLPIKWIMAHLYTSFTHLILWLFYTLIYWGYHCRKWENLFLYLLIFPLVLWSVFPPAILLLSNTGAKY